MAYSLARWRSCRLSRRQATLGESFQEEAQLAEEGKFERTGAESPTLSKSAGGAAVGRPRSFAQNVFEEGVAYSAVLDDIGDETVRMTAQEKQEELLKRIEEQADEPESQTNMTGAFGAELGQFQL